MDVVVMLAVICGYTSMLIRSTTSAMYNKQVNGAVAGISLMVPFLILTFVGITKLFPTLSKYLDKTKSGLMKWIRQCHKVVEVEGKRLYNHHTTDYHTFMP